MTALLSHLRERIGAGRKLLVPYLMGGVPDLVGWARAVRAIAPLADVIEVGLPYSDPLMDGPVIAAAGQRALNASIGPIDVLNAEIDSDMTPRVVMTYYNPIHRVGEEVFCAVARGSGYTGLIVPDLPLEESQSLRDAAAANELAWIALVAPTTSLERAARIAKSATGFLYAVSSLGVTGERTSLSERAAGVVEICREVSDLPVVVGIGITTPEQARAVVEFADGVVIGSAVVRLLAEQGDGAAVRFIEELREALDS
ncbi:MAG TPA: tryptophan synthase subunit alpha [Actinomycetota bacterium]|nr:tryptophan synthase subunit alpha [Actinomycetota bacterium]